jgi:hypothetical protein
VKIWNKPYQGNDEYSPLGVGGFNNLIFPLPPFLFFRENVTLKKIRVISQSD